MVWEERSGHLHIAGGREPPPLRRAGSAAGGGVSASVVFQESNAGAPKGRQCMKPGWSPCCCCDGACWLALPCVALLWSCSPALGLCAL